MKATSFLLLVPVVCAFCWPFGAAGAERHTNGLGGGRWTDPGSWHGGLLPAATDTVVVAAGDAIQFDMDGLGGPACAGLMIDPEGVLTARASETSHVLRVAGPVESYGMIRVDATRAPGARIEIRIETDRVEDRVIRLNRRGALLLYGPANAEGGGPVITLAACTAAGSNAAGQVTAGGDTLFDLSGVRIRDFAVIVSDLDNTGFEPGERLNITGCRFEGAARLELKECDSALVANNRFSWEGPAEAPASAFSSVSCKLTDAKLNVVSGRYPVGLDFDRETDGAVMSNQVNGAVVAGIRFRGCANAMIRANGVVDCREGLQLFQTTGAVEGMAIRGAMTAVQMVGSRLQLADLTLDETPSNAVALLLESSSATLLNGNIPEGAIKRVNTRPPPNKEPWVTLLYDVVVKVSGTVPPGCEVSLATAAASGGAPGGLADLNVRNSPARILGNGMTPLPRTQRCLVARGWQIEPDGKKKDAPFYDLTVLGPPDAKTGIRPVLKTQVVEPKEGWHRPDPDAPAATLEVKL